MAGRSLKPAKDRRLGEPLPHQLANPTRAHPIAKFFPLSGVYGITPSFPGLFRTIGKVPTCYSPVCHSPCGAFDLHVLGLPPAFVLSQDQTLKLKVLILDFGLEVNPRNLLRNGHLHNMTPAPVARNDHHGDGIETQSSPESVVIPISRPKSARTPPSAFPFLQIQLSKSKIREHKPARRRTAGFFRDDRGPTGCPGWNLRVSRV